MIYDAHTHISSFYEDENFETNLLEYEKLFSLSNYRAIVNAASEREFLSFKKVDNAFVSFGIHPWDTENFKEKSLKNIMEKFRYCYENADAIGEIGLDNVWCDCDEKTQIRIFEWQLEIAENLNKPVILHLKGMEKKALEIIKKFKARKLIHWYSCEDYLDEFIKQDCYFTIGMDILKGAVVSENLAKLLPINRLLVETDGLEAAEWALGDKFKVKDLEKLLMESMLKISKLRGISLEILKEQIEENFYNFLKS